MTARFWTLGISSIATVLAFGFAHAGDLGQAEPQAKDMAKAAACKMAKGLLQEGDVVFTEIDNFLYRKVAEGTNSWTSHVGIAFQDEEGSWFVAESAVPFSRTSELCGFLRRTKGTHFAIRRLKGVKGGLSAEAVTNMKLAADERMGKLYHFGFDYDSRRQFCSKFVYQVYKEALGIDVGRIQTFEELLAENPEGDTKFWKRWFLGRIPWQRRTVTPASQFVDDDLETILLHE